MVGTLHGLLDRRLGAGARGAKRWWHERVDLPLLRRLAGIHVTRPSEAESLGTAVRTAAPVLCAGWPLADGPGADPGVGAPRRPFFLYAGRIHPIKGLERLVRGLAVAARGREPHRLLLAGSGERSYVSTLSREATRVGLRETIEFLGHVEPSPLRALLSEASCLVLPSRYENFGMVVLEALREGCPVIASKETPWAELDAWKAGRWIDFDDAHAVARALHEVPAPPGRSELSRNARRLYEQEHGPTTALPPFDAWYRDALALSSAGTRP